MASALLLFSLLAVVLTARVMAGRVTAEWIAATTLYAPIILKEIDSPVHRMLQADPEYRHSLFERYAPMLKDDMQQLLRLGFNPRRYFWYGCFRAYYALLSMKHLPQWLGLERDGLRILLGMSVPAIRGAQPA